MLETLKIWNGRPCNIHFHNERMLASIQELFGVKSCIDLHGAVNVPDMHQKGLVKCRVIYGDRIHRVEFQSYQKKPVRSLRMVVDNNIDYSYKFEERGDLERLYGLRGDCDDILIVKNGLITDSTYANVAFYDGLNWFTPAKPLLRGAKRAKLLSEGILVEAELRPADIGRFKKACLINAMLDLGEMEVPVERIAFPEF